MSICDFFWYFIVTVLVIQIARFLYADADLTLLLWKPFGKKPASRKGKVVWVTGASSGIGEYLVYDLARAGCKLILSARRKEQLERVSKNCIDFWDVPEENVMVQELDLLEFGTHKAAVENVLNTMKTIDILVNNGGRSQRSLVEETEFAVDKALIDLNFLGTVSLTKAVLPHFMKRKSGHFVVTSSVAGKIGIPLMASYSASKFALQGWFDTLRVEAVAHNIKVTMVCPGPVYSNGTEEAITEKVNKKHGIPQAMNENRMMTERCSELMISAIANELSEVWISNNPVLLFTYLSQYTPSTAKWFASKLGLRTIKKLRQP